MAAAALACISGCDRPVGATIPSSVMPSHMADAGAEAATSLRGATAGDAASGAPVATETGATSIPPPALCQITIGCDSDIPDQPDIMCTFSLTDGEGETEFADHAGIELHGRSSRTFPKKNYSIDLRDATGAAKSADLLGMSRDSEWILDGMWADRSLMRNALIFDGFRDVGPLHYGARGRFCTLSLNGEPQGIYRIEEKIKRSPDRVAIAADPGTGASFIIKQDSDGVVTLFVGGEERWKIVYPDQDKASTQQIAGVQAWLNALGTALDHPNDPQAGLLTLLDHDATVDWILFQEMMKNIDAYDGSVFFSRDSGGLARLIPWDFDLSLGEPTVLGDTNVPANDQAEGWVIRRSRLTQALLEVPTITLELPRRWRQLRAGPLATTALLSRLDGYATTLRPDAVRENFTIWPLAQIDYMQIWPIYSVYPVSSYADETAKVAAFLTARLAWIDSHIDGFPN